MFDKLQKKIYSKKENKLPLHIILTLDAMKIKNLKIILIVLILLSRQTVFSLSMDSLRGIVDTILIPSAEIYKHTWGGSNTRLKTDLLDKQSNYCLPLQLEGDSKFVFPCVNKTYICSPYGMRSGKMHTGMDIKQNLGDSIVAAWDGVVRMASKSYYGYGGTIVIRHANGLETLYSHLSALDVEENQTVKAGDLIGRAGRTGRATTEHLHFETRFLYEHFDPRTIIDFNTFSLSADTLYVQKGKFRASNIALVEDITSTDSNSIASDSLSMLLQDTNVVKTSTPEQKETEPPMKMNPQIYIVKKGDTLYSISKKYNMSVHDLCKLNNLTNETILNIGQELKIE